MASNVENIINLMEMVIQNDQIDSPKGQYKNWKLHEFTSGIPSPITNDQRILKFRVSGEEESQQILNYFQTKGCSATAYAGEKSLINYVILSHR